MNTWLKANKLAVNIKKTHYMMFHRTRIKLNTNFQILNNNNIIYRTNNNKFLGVIIDNKMNWSAHLHYIKNTISKSIGILFKIQNFLDNHTLRSMYFNFIYLYLIYCVEVCHLDLLIKIQKKSIRTITFSHYLDHIAPLFQRLNILDFEKLVKHRIYLLMFKNHLNMLPTPLSDLFMVNNTMHDHFTRQHNDLHNDIGIKENVYRFFLVFMVHISGTIFFFNP